LTHSPADILGQLLHDLGLGVIAPTTSNWPIFIANTPDSPDNLITLTDTTGKLQGRIMVSGEAVAFPGLQIKVRGVTHQVGWTKINAIAEAMDKNVKLSTVRIDSTTYTVTCVDRSGDIAKLGSESPTSKRKNFTLNLLVTVHQN